jgi:hypothetical protein
MDTARAHIVKDMCVPDVCVAVVLVYMCARRHVDALVTQDIGESVFLTLPYPMQVGVWCGKRAKMFWSFTPLSPRTPCPLRWKYCQS